ncbi:hypothetical protein H5397_11050 [Propioniciclava sp. MC1683]|uniref:FxLYD domain-containing protein n=1 Tax=Propioniciclava sp. MC1683 TaxID=2760309 RepID=UPI001601D90D|nr:FxLYD domain-containing protein [Propioniciclava sp. MC1683]MBB1501953.1 hypothetical protein [Propioniciclava sp. MC1683]
MSQTQPGQVPPFPGAQPPPAAKPKKPWFKKWWVWVLAVLVLVGIGNALGGGGGDKAAAPSQSVSTPAPAGSSDAAAPAASEAPAEPAQEPAKERLTLEDGWEIDRSNPFAIFITGYVANNSDRPVDTYVQITFDALDKEGANVGTCIANTNTIDAQGKWKFKAMCTGEAEEIETVRFKDITGF